MSSIRAHGKNKFQDNWLSKTEYKIWLEKKNDYIAKCKLCRKDISVDNMGETALKSHVSTGKDSRLVKEHKEPRNSLSVLHFLPQTSSSTADSTSTSTSTPKASSANLQEIAIPLSVISAEIKWALKSVLSHFSMPSLVRVK